ncbi:MAG: phosphoribosylaminoimidazolesuccinocarboxamide synthase [Spirochaetia bacterium]|jgi:phosphoribosylaminoimidazole-succinocarboxamide synthase|nr:phosphoribosylaminoimidazolesuccinocarboxamide synthase [Spirochaetia bacterium]
MPIDEKLITRGVLDNTLAREVYPELRVAAEPKMGKVRTVYDLGDERMIMISSDNLSTHDVVHRRLVYGKGENLDAISGYYFGASRHIVSNHLIEVLAPNVWLVQKASPILVEMVFRKYLTGSGWKDYKRENGPEEGSEFCGVELRPGYRKNEMLDGIIFTPTGKGQVKDFDIPEFRGLDPETDDPKITIEIIRKNFRKFGLRKPEDLDYIMEKAFSLYSFIYEDLLRKGYLLVDTKWEFGYMPDGTIALIDECVTPDSSRFWAAGDYVFNPVKKEFNIIQEDKQHFRDYIESLGLQNPERKTELANHMMDDEVLRQGVVKYCNIREIISGTLPKITIDSKKAAVLAVLSDAGFLK